MSEYVLEMTDVCKSFPGVKALDHAQLKLHPGKVHALMGENGAGKSTLMKCMFGIYKMDEGQIKIDGQPVTIQDPMDALKKGIAMVHQELQPIPARTVGENIFLGRYPMKKFLGIIPMIDHDKMYADTAELLKKVRMNFDPRQKVGELSGGQLKRVALANVLLLEPDFLILDEPTNHLDLEMIEWLEGYLRRGNKTLLMVTHDRYFLDEVCNLILEIDDETIYTYRGNYSYYLEKRQERIDNARAEIARANNLYRKELDWMRRQPQARGHKARYREEAFYDLEAKAKRRIEERQMRLKSSSIYIGSKIFECQYVSKAFERADGTQKVILKDFYYNFARFEKMGIVGKNGTGKSTFVKMLLGKVEPDGGRFDIGDTVRFGYFSQEGLQFREDQKVIDIVKDIADYIDLGGGRHMTASQFLNYFLFPPEMQHNYVAKLSGGERRKLYLCTVLMRNPNFLVLDEPTNDLDIQTLQVLEEYLQDFPGCVIVISHDRYFTDKVVDHLLVFHGEGDIQDFPGNYTQYRDYQKLKSKEEDDRCQEEKKPKRERADYRNETRRKMTYKEKMEFERLEKEMGELEQEREQLEAALCSGTLSIDELTEKSKRLPEVKELIDEKEMRWLELSEIGG